MIPTPILDILTSSREHGVTCLSHLICLHHLRDSSANMTDLARAAGLTTPAITGIVDSFEKLNFASRLPSKQDRRVTIIALTTKGKAAISKILAGTSPAPSLEK